MARTIPLTNSPQRIIVDDEDYDRVKMYGWTLQHNIKTDINTKTTTLARFILNYDGSLQIDHIDRDVFNNQKSNLRFATPSQNAMNRPAYNSKSSFKGVAWSTLHNKWRVRIQVNGKRLEIGLFKNEKGAAHAYDRAAIKYHGEFAVLNFPKETPNA